MKKISLFAILVVLNTVFLRVAFSQLEPLVFDVEGGADNSDQGLFKFETANSTPAIWDGTPGMFQRTMDHLKTRANQTVKTLVTVGSGVGDFYIDSVIGIGNEYVSIYNKSISIPGDLLFYGNWHGPGWSGGKKGGEIGSEWPIDSLDEICMWHDFAYQIAKEQGAIFGPSEEYRLKAIADDVALKRVEELGEDPRKWPNFPSNASQGQIDEAKRHKKRFVIMWLQWGSNRGGEVSYGDTSTFREYIFLMCLPPKMTNDELDQQANARIKRWKRRNGQSMPTDWYETQPSSRLSDREKLTAPQFETEEVCRPEDVEDESGGGMLPPPAPGDENRSDITFPGKNGGQNNTTKGHERKLEKYGR